MGLRLSKGGGGARQWVPCWKPSPSKNIASIDRLLPWWTPSWPRAAPVREREIGGSSCREEIGGLRAQIKCQQPSWAVGARARGPCQPLPSCLFNVWYQNNPVAHNDWLLWSSVWEISILKCVIYPRHVSPWWSPWLLKGLTCWHCFKYRPIYWYIGRDTGILFKTIR